MIERDILIIGGGPGGLSTALHIARDFPHLTRRMTLLEKARYPRPKLCAGGLVIDAEVILQRLGLDVGEVPHVDVDNLHFDFESKGLTIRVPRKHALRVIRRDEFDNWLAAKAESRGIEIREEVTVRHVFSRQDHVMVETDQGEYRAKVIVGADGSNGITRRCIFPHAPVHTARVLEVLTPSLPADDSLQRNGRREQAYFDFLPVPENIAGYIWDFPTQVNGEAMRCWGIYDTNILAGEKRPQLKAPLAREMERVRLKLDEYEIKGHPIRWFSPENPMSAPRVLLVGDAAGADPLFGEGISFALGYGILAAREIGEAFNRNDFLFGKYRGRVLRSPLGQAMLARWIIAYVIYSFKWKWFQVLLWRILKPVVLAVAWLFVLNWGKRL
ncbi:MAG TPA: FAD-dependent monooxygenase [Anaerolineales bacterium]|nr:FAD-dependent monooxygenase [Anaerolineales bacterium]